MMLNFFSIIYALFFLSFGLDEQILVGAHGPTRLGHN